MIDTEKYMGKDIIGFYYCDIDQSNLRASNLPKIYAKKTEIENDWGHEEVLENYLISNVMIELLKRHKCKVIIKKGFYFTEKKRVVICLISY
jgi:UDP-N-acetylglucosamine:LPS N-acetylglucosamine transferase